METRKPYKRLAERRTDMLNPLAVGVMVLGAVLLLFGAFWAIRRSQAQGIVVALCGVILAASPFLVSLFLRG